VITARLEKTFVTEATYEKHAEFYDSAKDYYWPLKISSERIITEYMQQYDYHANIKKVYSIHMGIDKISIDDGYF
jgi:hypothetical protein